MRITEEQLREIIRGELEGAQTPVLASRVAQWIFDVLDARGPTEEGVELSQVLGGVPDIDVPARIEDLESFVDETTNAALSQLRGRLKEYVAAMVLVVYKRLMR
jgi:hypothetical protein